MRAVLGMESEVPEGGTKCVSANARKPVRSYPVEIEDGKVVVELP